MRRPRVDYDNIDSDIIREETEFGYKISYQNFDDCLTKVSVKTKEEANKIIVDLIKEREKFSIYTITGFKYPFKHNSNKVVLLDGK